MDLLYLKVVLLVNGWLYAGGSPVAMLQHATSSQSIVFHQDLASPSPAANTPSPPVRYSNTQPKYEYKYEVSDHQTGDRKSHWESREGDRVRGAYTLYEPDGALRTVEYSADAVHGFNAVVRRNVPSKHQYNGQSTNTNQGTNNPFESSGNGGFTSNRNIFSSRTSGNAAPRYPESIANQPGDVGFSVVHGQKNSGDGSVDLY